MDTEYVLGLSKQSLAVYKLLLNGGTLSASEIGEAVHITKYHIYRLTKQLHSLGFIDLIEGYPVKYKAVPLNEAREIYLNRCNSGLLRLFANNSLTKLISQKVSGNRSFEISFFQSRDEHIEQFIKQSNNAKFSIKFIILSLAIGVPAELMLAHMNAVKRGVDVKLLAIEHTKENHSILMSYKQMGVQVRHGKFLGWHLFLIDDDNTSINMFDGENKAIHTGVNFVHREINRELQGIFEKYWSEAVPV